MAKKQKKVNFHERRYPKSPKGKAKEAMLPDDVFWPVYYGICLSGIVSQFNFHKLWHAIKCLEDGFKDDDAGLLQARKELAGLEDVASSFVEEHKAVFDTPAFKEREALLQIPPFPERNSSGEWESRAIRANLEFAWYQLNQMEEFHKVMEFSSVSANDKISWFGLLMGSASIGGNTEGRWWTLPRGRLRDLDFNAAFALVEECAESELHEVCALMDGLHNQELVERQMECIEAFLFFLARQRAAYAEAYPQPAALDDKKGHSNFGLNIDVTSLPTFLEEEDNTEA